MFTYHFVASILLLTTVIVSAIPSHGVVETTSFCGGVVTHTFGNITSPNYPAHYDDLLHCKWIFQAEPDHRLIFQFHELFSTELGYDRVTIYDGAGPVSPVIIEWSGNQSQGHIFSTTDNLATVRFTSDNSLNFPGFALYYSSEPKPPCGGYMINSSGVIETPDFPAHYPSAMQCRWIITAAVNHRILLSFPSFQTEPGRDILTVMDPITEVPLLIHSGYSVPDPIISPSNQMLILFKTDYMINHPGFEIDYKIV